MEVFYLGSLHRVLSVVVKSESAHATSIKQDLPFFQGAFSAAVLTRCSHGLKTSGHCGQCAGVCGLLRSRCWPIPAVQVPALSRRIRGNTRCPIAVSMLLFSGMASTRSRAPGVRGLLNTGHACLCLCRYVRWVFKELPVCADPLHPMPLCLRHGLHCKHNYESAQHRRKIICKFICTCDPIAACFSCHAHGKRLTICA